MFANRLKQLRKENDMTQVQLAEALGVSKGTVAMWETGKRRPSFEALDQLTDIFDKRMDYILGYSDDSSPSKLSEAEIDQLGSWEVEDIFHEIFMSYLALDEFGRNAVDALIKSEKLRCYEQQTLCDTDGVQISVRVKP